MSETAASSRARRARALASLFTRPHEAWLAVRTMAWFVVIPLLKRTLSLKRLVRLMCLSPCGPRDVALEARTVRIVAGLSRTSGGNCLERSLVLYRYLSRAGADPRLVVGMAGPEQYLGHVWVTVDGRPLLEPAESIARYEVVTTFGPEGRRLT